MSVLPQLAQKALLTVDPYPAPTPDPHLEPGWRWLVGGLWKDLDLAHGELLVETESKGTFILLGMGVKKVGRKMISPPCHI